PSACSPSHACERGLDTRLGDEYNLRAALFGVKLQLSSPLLAGPQPPKSDVWGCLKPPHVARLLAFRSSGGPALSREASYSACAACSRQMNRKEKTPAAMVVCEDDPAHRELIRASLARGNYRLFEIEDGRHLLGAVRSTLPDLLILDIRMPESDGIDALERLRADAATGDVSVLVLPGAVPK